MYLPSFVTVASLCPPNVKHQNQGIHQSLPEISPDKRPTKGTLIMSPEISPDKRPTKGILMMSTEISIYLVPYNNLQI
jgi:hypothetical protein